MRILHVIPSIEPESGGPVEGLRQLCAIYSQNGHEVEVASMDSPERVRQISFPCMVHGLGPSQWAYAYSRRAIPWFKKNIAKFDVVLLNCIWNYSTVAAHHVLCQTRVPYAVFTHGMLDPYFKKRYPLKHIKKTIYWYLFLRRVLNKANTVFFTCEEERVLARQSFGHYEVRETVVPYGSFGPSCNLDAARESFLLRCPHLRGKRIAISLGRIHPKKGIDILIEAYAGTLGKDEGWQLVIAGPDQVGWKKELEAVVNGLGIQERVTWTGMLEGELKWGAFAAAEIFVLPSHQENFGIVVAEAMCCSLPVIISSRINIWREIVDYGAGLVNDDTVEGTRDSLNRWLQLDASESKSVGLRARRCFEEKFDYRVTSKLIMESIVGLPNSI